MAEFALTPDYFEVAPDGVVVTGGDAAAPVRLIVCNTDTGSP